MKSRLRQRPFPRPRISWRQLHRNCESPCHKPQSCRILYTHLLAGTCPQPRLGPPVSKLPSPHPPSQVLSPPQRSLRCEIIHSGHPTSCRGPTVHSPHPHAFGLPSFSQVPDGPHTRCGFRRPYIGGLARQALQDNPSQLGLLSRGESDPSLLFSALVHEASIYAQLAPLHGIHIPVYLGNINLEFPDLEFGLQLPHFMLLSHAGTRLNMLFGLFEWYEKGFHRRMWEVARRIEEIGVVHGDLVGMGELRWPNMLWDQRTGKAMLCDFERSKMVEEDEGGKKTREPLESIIEEDQEAAAGERDREGSRNERREDGGVEMFVDDEWKCGGDVMSKEEDGRKGKNVLGDATGNLARKMDLPPPAPTERTGTRNTPPPDLIPRMRRRLSLTIMRTETRTKRARFPLYGGGHTEFFPDAEKANASTRPP